MIPVKVLRPSYTLDLAGVRTDDSTGDLVPGDAAELMLLTRINAEAVSLYRLAGAPPCLAYVTTPAALRVLDAHIRLAGVRSRFVEPPPSEGLREAYNALLAGDLDVLVTRHRFGAGPPVPLAVMMVVPTLQRESFHAFLGRLRPVADEIVVIDLADNIRRHGVPESWTVNIVEGEPQDVVRDPRLDRLGTMSAPELQRWAEGDRGRLEIAARVKGFKPGWVQFSVDGWLNRQIKARGTPPRPDGNRGSARPRARG
jgi:hypothetical protein